MAALNTWSSRPAAGHDESSTVVRARGLTKSYGPLSALAGVDLAIDRGQVFGLLGPNGAGKTTLLRTLLGLVRPDSGAISIFGQAPGSPAALQRVGALIESPAFVPRLSGRTNLRILARARGLADAEVERVLGVVDLTARGDDRFAAYSLGMSQRLGVAAAMLGDRELLILDEPTNGLDPDGVVQLRGLLRRLSGEGKTVLFSSHMLHEVEQTCDRVLVMRKGLVVIEGAVEELRQQASGAPIMILARPHERAGQVLKALPQVSTLRSVARGDDYRWECMVESAAIPDTVRALVAAGLDLAELTPQRQSLEDAFFSLTADGIEPQEPDSASGRPGQDDAGGGR